MGQLLLLEEEYYLLMGGQKWGLPFRWGGQYPLRATSHLQSLIKYIEDNLRNQIKVGLLWKI